MKRHYWRAAAGLAVASLLGAAPAQANSRLDRGSLTAGITSQDWPAFLFSPAHPSATTGPTAITVGNAGSLRLAWSFQERPPTGVQPPGGFSASPTVADGLVFIGSQTGDFYALDEITGTLRWWKTLDYEQVGNNGNCKHARGIVATATVAPDPSSGMLIVYVAGARYLYALDAATGAQRWKSLVGPAGSASLTGTYYNYASPTVANARLYMGISSSCDAPFVRGGVEAFSQQSGAALQTFWTDPSGQVGASVWSSIAAGTKWVWTTTGDPQFTGTHLYHAYSFLQLTATTLALRGAWQLKLPQAADLDFGSSPTFFSGTVRGAPTALVGACNKNGIYYALRRYDLTAGPVWSRQIGESEQAGKGLCLASASWNSSTGKLYLASNATTIGGISYAGSVREVSPGSGQVAWARGLPCAVFGTPTLDAATGVLAVTLWSTCAGNGSPAVYLLNAATGAVLGTLPLRAAGYAQPVFAGPYLLVASMSGRVAAYSVTASGIPVCTGWCTGPPPPLPPLVPPVP